MGNFVVKIDFFRFQCIQWFDGVSGYLLVTINWQEPIFNLSIVIRKVLQCALVMVLDSFSFRNKLRGIISIHILQLELWVFRFQTVLKRRCSPYKIGAEQKQHDPDRIMCQILEASFYHALSKSVPFYEVSITSLFDLQIIFTHEFRSCVFWMVDYSLSPQQIVKHILLHSLICRHFLEIRFKRSLLAFHRPKNNKSDLNIFSLSFTFFGDVWEALLIILVLVFDIFLF